MVTIIFIFSLIYFSAIIPQTSTICIKQSNGARVYRTVYDPQGYFKWHVLTGKEFYITGEAASAEIYAYVISLQKRFSKLPQKPIIVRKIPSTNLTHCCFEGGIEKKSFCYFDVTIDDLSLDIRRKFFLGHELGHLAYANEYDYWVRQNTDSRWCIATAGQGTLMSLACIDIAGVALLLGELYFKNDTMSRSAVSAVGIFAAISALFRLWGHSHAQGCHEEELYCDIFALNTACNEAEKRAMIESAREVFCGNNKRSWIEVLSYVRNKLLRASTHPEGAERIALLEKALGT